MSRAEANTSEASTQTRRRWLAWVQNLLGAAVLIGFGHYLWGRREHFASVLAISVGDVALLIATTLVTWMAASTQSWVLYRASGARVGFCESFVLATATGFGNYLPARIGTIARAHYLKSVHGLRYARFGSIQGIRTVQMVVATGLTGIAGTLGVAASGGRLSLELLAVFAVLCCLPVLAWLWRPPPTRAGAGRIRRIVNDFVEGFAQLRARPGVSLVALALVLIQLVSLAVRFLIAAHAIGAEPSVAVLLLWAPLAALSLFAALTPGGLGIREAIMGYATFATGASFDEGLYVGTLDRAVLLGMMALFGSASFITVWARIRRAERTQPPRP